VPPEKFGVAPLPQFVLQQGETKIAGILGMDTLYIGCPWKEQPHLSCGAEFVFADRINV